MNPSSKIEKVKKLFELLESEIDEFGSIVPEDTDQTEMEEAMTQLQAFSEDVRQLKDYFLACAIKHQMRITDFECEG